MHRVDLSRCSFSASDCLTHPPFICFNTLPPPASLLLASPLILYLHLPSAIGITTAYEHTPLSPYIINPVLTISKLYLSMYLHITLVQKARFTQSPILQPAIDTSTWCEEWTLTILRTLTLEDNKNYDLCVNVSLWMSFFFFNFHEKAHSKHFDFFLMQTSLFLSLSYAVNVHFKCGSIMCTHQGC